MKKTLSRLPMLLLVITVIFSASAAVVSAASTSQAEAPFDPDRMCRLTVLYQDEETFYQGQTVQLYRVADWSADYVFTPTGTLAGYGLQYNGLTEASQWDTVTQTLTAHIAAEGVTPDAVKSTDRQGKAAFAQLTPGLYLVRELRIEDTDSTRVFYDTMITLPALDDEGHWIYDLTVIPKSEKLAPTYEDVTYRVNVIWNDKGFESYRPQSLPITIYRNGEVYAEPLLTASTDGENPVRQAGMAVRAGSLPTVAFGMAIPVRQSGTVSNGSLLTAAVGAAASVVSSGGDSAEPPATLATDWHYEWTVPDDGSQWNVVGADVAHYTHTVRREGNTWILEYVITGNEQPKPTPKTGDESHVLLAAAEMAAGLFLLFFGLRRKRTADE